jgi:hypothetical protein
MVGGDNAAARRNPQVAVCDERKQDQVAVWCFRSAAGAGAGALAASRLALAADSEKGCIDGPGFPAVDQKL